MAILFMFFLAALGIVLPYVLAYAARCVLVVLQGTAAGADKVHWPDDLFYDWFGQSLALLAVVAVCLVPAGLLGRALQEIWLPGQTGLRTLLLAGPVLWLVFPIGALSSLRAGSSWVFFQPVIVSRMLRLLPATMQFYAVSAVCGCLAVGPLFSCVQTQSLPLLLLAAPLSAAMVLIYARLLGLLGWKIVHLGPLAVTARSRLRKLPRRRLGNPPVPEREFPMPKPAPVAEEDKELVTLIPESPTGLLDLDNLEPYQLAGDKGPREVRQDEPPPPRTRPLDAEEEDALLGFTMGDVPTTLRDSHADNPDNEHFRRAEAHLSSAVQPPPGTSVGSIVGFPWREGSLEAWLWLSLGLAVIGTLVIQCIQTVPV